MNSTTINITMLLFVLFIQGCGIFSNDHISPPYQARIVSFTPTGYILQTVTFTTLENIDAMDGSVAVIKGDAALDLDADTEEIINPQNKDSIYLEPGKTVRLDYKVKDNIIYPKNFDSMAMLAIYYNYERTFLFWQEHLGLDLNDFGKLRLFFNPTIKLTSKEGTLEGSFKVNAAFLPGPRDFFLFKTSRIEQLPINMNFGVMAHEFGHAIFDYKFAKKNAEVYLTNNEEAEKQLSGINEGLADFFSYMVTLRTEEFGESLDRLKQERTLPVSWTYKTLASANCDGDGDYYCKGSILASALYEISQSKDQSALKVGNVVYNALDDFLTDWQNNKEKTSFNYHFIIKRIIDAAGDTNKTLYCTVFKKWFDLDVVSSNIGC